MSTKRDAVTKLYQQYVMSTYAQTLVLDKGRGTKVWDIDGKVYLDFASGIAVLNVGYSHPRVVKAVQDQAARLMHVSNLYFNENQALLAERLSSIAMGGRCFFANSGAEANEGMIKLARLWGNPKGKYEVICMKNSFHGRTLATAAATGQIKVQKGFEPMPEGFCYADYNNLASVKEQINESTVAVLVEAVQGEGGVIPADDAFMKGLRKLCDESELLMLCDEVQCGMGRTGQWFAFEHYGVQPDCASLAKALGSGFPIGAIVSGPKLSEIFKPGKHASTFGGNPLACAAALATLDVIEEEELVARASDKGAEFMELLGGFADVYEHVKGVRGRGLMVGLVLDTDPKPLAEKLMEAGLLAIPTGDTVLRFLPPLNAKDEEYEEALEILDDCLADWHGMATDEAEE